MTYMQNVLTHDTHAKCVCVCVCVCVCGVSALDACNTREALGQWVDLNGWDTEVDRLMGDGLEGSAAPVCIEVRVLLNRHLHLLVVHTERLALQVLERLPVCVCVCVCVCVIRACAAVVCVCVSVCVCVCVCMCVWVETSCHLRDAVSERQPLPPPQRRVLCPPNSAPSVCVGFKV